MPELIPPLPLENSSQDVSQIELAEQALVQSRQSNVAEHPEIASEMIALGDLYRGEGKIEKTLPLYEEALKIIDQYAYDTPGYYRIAHEIGALYDELDQPGKALHFYEEAIRLSTDVRGVDSCEVATIYNNLALAYKRLGDPAQAEAYYHKALEIYEKMRGADHPEVAAMLNNLGALYIAQQDFDMAEVMHLRALNLRQKAYGSNHPDVAQSFSNLAVVYHSQQNWKKAGSYYRDALDILGKQAKTDWPEYSIILRNYADFLRQTGKTKKAEDLESELNARLDQVAANI